MPRDRAVGALHVIAARPYYPAEWHIPGSHRALEMLQEATLTPSIDIATRDACLEQYAIPFSVQGL